MKNIHTDIYIGMLMLLMSGFFYSLASEMPPEPAVFPKLILLILAVFSLVIIIKGILETLRARNEERSVERYFQKIRGPAVVYVALCSYVALIEVLGFFTASTLASAFFMIIFGVRSYKRILLVLAGINAFIYLLFIWQLQIALPMGVLI
jgi:hypothetical protein